MKNDGFVFSPDENSRTKVSSRVKLQYVSATLIRTTATKILSHDNNLLSRHLLAPIYNSVLITTDYGQIMYDNV